MFRANSRWQLFAAAAVLALVSGPALAQSEASRAKIGPSVDTPSLYGAFLAGEAQIRSGAGEDGAKLLIEAAEDKPGDQLLREHAFAAALLIGDIPAAARLAPGDDDPATAFKGLGALTRAVDALADDRGAEADKLLNGPTVGFPHHAATLVLRPFAAAEAGDWDRAVAAHNPEGERLLALLDQSTRAELLELRGRYADAEAIWKVLGDDQITAALFAQSYGEFLERRGRARDAIGAYQKGLAASPGDPGLVAALNRARGGRSMGEPPPPLTIKRAASEAMGYASGAMAGERQAELSLIYARLALRLDPHNGQAWLNCGDALAIGKDEVEARACWSRIEAGDRHYVEARSRIAYSLQRSGDVEGALAAARELARGGGARHLQGEMLLAELLRGAERWGEAADALDQVVNGGGGDWRVLYLRAAMREKLGRWPDAETDLKEALRAAPDEPELLNFLGYQWIDRGEDVKGGLAMIERAVKSRPNSGPMQDSLGWAHYRMGDYSQAVGFLEAAVMLEPSDPEINDHLGDAYWMVGRKDEAGYQWRRVLTFSPDAALKASVEAKLKDGLKIAAQGAGK
jgi:tetratricopeptide (TPR) repeat protein